MDGINGVPKIHHQSEKTSLDGVVQSLPSVDPPNEASPRHCVGYPFNKVDDIGFIDREDGLPFSRPSYGLALSFEGMNVGETDEPLLNPNWIFADMG